MHVKITLAALFVALLAVVCRADDLSAELVNGTTADGVQFATLGSKPAKPAPTLFVFATDVGTSLTEPVYLKAGIDLIKQGWLCASLDLPCHGAQHRDGEPAGLEGWRHRINAGEDPMAEFTDRCRRVLDYLIAEGYTDPERVAVCGTSRGGFSALHFAAADPRVRCAAGYAPVTDLKALQEFHGAEQAPLVRQLALEKYSDKLSRRAVWIVIGDTDQRVGTDLAISLARAISASAADGKLPSRVELHVLPAVDHTTPAGAQEQSAEWILRNVGATGAEAPQR